MATDAIIEEWKKAFFFLADIFINVEKKKYEEQSQLEGKFKQKYNVHILFYKKFYLQKY